MIGIAAVVEHHPVAGNQRSFRINFQVVGAHLFDESHKWPALLPKPRVHEFLMIHPMQPARVQAARKRHLKLVLIGPVRGVWLLLERRINRLAIHLTSGRYVFWRLKTTFNLKSTHPKSE